MTARILVVGALAAGAGAGVDALVGNSAAGPWAGILVGLGVLLFSLWAMPARDIPRGAPGSSTGHARLVLGEPHGAPVIIVRGDAYSRGYQLGEFFCAELLAEAPGAARSAASHVARSRWLRPLGAALLDMAYRLDREMRADAQRELQGLADGSGADLKSLRRLHALVVTSEWGGGAEAKVAWLSGRGWRRGPLVVVGEMPGGESVVSLRAPLSVHGVTGDGETIVAMLGEYSAPVIVDVAAARRHSFDSSGKAARTVARGAARPAGE